MKYEPKKVFILEHGKYIELSYQEFFTRCKSIATYQEKNFISLHGMLMEVTEDVQEGFYKDRRRQKYLEECSLKNGEFSYDMLTTEDFNGEDILPDPKADVAESVEKKIMLDRLQESMSMLTDKERELIYALFFLGLSEREWSAQTGIPQKTINDRKHRILEKLKKYIDK